MQHDRSEPDAAAIAGPDLAVDRFDLHDGLRTALRAVEVRLPVGGDRPPVVQPAAAPVATYPPTPPASPSTASAGRRSRRSIDHR